MSDRPNLLGSVAVVLAACGFGLLGPLARFAYDEGFAPLSFVAWRAFFGFLIIAAVVAVRTRRDAPFINPLTLARDDRIGLFVVAFAGFALNVAMFFAFDLTTVALVLLAFYTYPALVALVAVVLGHEHLDGSRWLALALALGGMVLVVAGGLASEDSRIAIEPLGIVLGLVAAAWQTLFVTVSRGRFVTLPSEQAMIWVLLLTAVACFGLAGIAGNRLDIPVREPRALGLAVFSGVVAAGIPSVLFLVGLRRIGGTRAAILMLLEPLVGVALAALLLNEALLPVQAAGGVAILGAAMLLRRGPAGGPDLSATPVTTDGGTVARAAERP